MTTDKTRIDYPADEPPLAVDNRYWLIVTASNGKNSRQDEVSFQRIGFTVVAEAVRTEIEASMEPLGLEDHTPEQKVLAQAEFYGQEGFKQPAIDLLETAVAPEDKQNARKYREMEPGKHRVKPKKDW